MNDMQKRMVEYQKILTYAINKGEEEVHRIKRMLCREDLFYLMVEVLHRKDIIHPWLFDRCCDVQEEPNEHLDLWARESYKSTLITFGKTIQDILVNPETTACIFSHTKPIARAFLKQIKTEFENNEELKELFPEILWSDPKKECMSKGFNWSVEKGITVKRESNPKEATLESHGLVDGQPTSRHFSLLIYDDVVTLESVSTPEQIKKTTEALSLSYNLGSKGGHRRFIGTRYHLFDTYATIMKRGTVIPRIHPATKSGKGVKDPVFLTEEELAKKRRDMGKYVYASQMLQDPTAESAQGFEIKWLRYYGQAPPTRDMNIYIVVDPANEKKKTSDFTSMWVIGLAADQNYYLLDGVYDRLNLTERAQALFTLHSRWHPMRTGYERIGMQSDVQHIKYEMEHRSYRFQITELGSIVPKPDRIKRLVPVFEDGRMYLPETLPYITLEGKEIDIIANFIETEYSAFPVGAHDDALDNMSQILDPKMKCFFPNPQANQKIKVLSGLRR